MTAIKKYISIIATGTEIVQGDIQDTNSHFFASLIHKNGGVVYQSLQCNDYQLEIENAIHYLAGSSDAIIMCGGLGPTSDDLTRFALSNATEQTLVFNEMAWSHIANRLEGFGVVVSDANRQQALFPAEATLLPNPNGTALGCYFYWHEKHFFMLPGPPKECRPMFELLLPILEKNNFFKKTMTHRWTTLGLVEGEIASRIDAIAKDYPVETGYRWHYPYLDIKLSCNPDENIASLLSQVESLLSSHTVSKGEDDAIVVLLNSLQHFKDPIDLLDSATEGQLIEKIKTQCTFSENSPIRFVTDSQFNQKQIMLSVKGYRNAKLMYEHALITPNRGPEIIDFKIAYFAWQLSAFILKLG